MAISAGLVTFLLATADVGRVKMILAGAKPLPLLAATGLFFIGMLLFAYRWRLVLAARNPDTPGVRFLTGVFLIGLFFNFFLPSTVGGDVVRAELVRSRVRGRTEAYTSVLFDRFMAFNAILVIGFVSAVVARLQFGWFDPHAALAWLVFFFGSAAFALAVLWPVTRRDSTESRPRRCRLKIELFAWWTPGPPPASASCTPAPARLNLKISAEIEIGVWRNEQPR